MTDPIGILMLDTQFPRIPGDVGNPASWPFPVLLKTVEGAWPARVVRDDPAALLPAFIEAGQALVADGAIGITTSCGFLSLFQQELAATLPVPVATSALLQITALNTLLAPGRCAGILTISASTLTDRHLAAAHVPQGTPIGTTEGGREFTRAILENRPTLDHAAARQDMIDAARRLHQNHPELGAIVLECTNMGPYAADVARATGLPVHSILSFIRWFRDGIQPPGFH